MRIYKIILSILVFFPVLAAQATDVEGDVWGTWTKDNSPYNVVGEVRVPPESTLVIEPGVVVNFQGHYKFIVDSLATIQAVGAAGDSIHFTTDDPTTGWNAIRFMSASSSSRLSYCVVEYGNGTGSGSDNYGGAIYCYLSDPTISNNRITDNSANIGGGGICCRESSPTISSNYIKYNFADYGGGIFCRDASPTIGGNYIRYNSASYGGGIYCWKSSATISNNRINQNTAERFGGGIHCEDQSSMTIENNTISLNLANERGAGVYCENSNPGISNNDIIENVGGGIYCYDNANPVISNNTISQNVFTDLGGGICCQFYSSPTVMNNIISGNSADEGGGILCTNFCDPTINNNTITANSADSGGGIGCKYYSNPTIINTVLWGDMASEGQEIYLVESSNPTVTYCDVEGGWEGEGNIDLDPLFRDPNGDDFHLMADYCGDPDNSPCIDAGHPDSLDGLLDCFHGLGTDRADMGAYGGSNSGWPTGVEDEKTPPIPKQFLLHQNHPNPFNAATTIDYQLPVHGHVKLEVYNLLGQRVATLVDSKQQTGYRSVVWDAYEVSSGLYFYRLTAADFTETRRMMLVK